MTEQSNQAPIATGIVTREQSYALATNMQGQNKNICPASAYITSLQARTSQITMASYLSTVAKIIGKELGQPYTSFRDYDWRQINRQQIQAVIALLVRTQRSPATINTCLHALRGVAREAWTLGHIDYEAYAHCQTVKPVRGSRISKGQAMSGKDIQALLQVCSADTTEIGVRDLAIFSLMLATGLRRSEVTALSLSSLNRANGEIRVVGKGNKERLAILPPQIRKHVNFWIDQVRGDDEGPLFCRIQKGGHVTAAPLTPPGVMYLLNKRCLEAGIGLFSPHDLRRTFATMLLNEGEDLLVVRDAMGHSSVNVTEKYIVRDGSQVRSAAGRQGERLAELLGDN